MLRNQKIESLGNGRLVTEKHHSKKTAESTAFIVAGILVLCLGLAACGRSATPEPTVSSEATQSETAVDETQTPSVEPSPSATESPVSSTESTEEAGLTDDFAAGDFKVPTGSLISREAWIAFLRETMRDKLSWYSGVVGFVEAFGFTAEAGAGSGEYQISCNAGISWFSPGSQTADFETSRDTLSLVMVVLEQGQNLKLLNMDSEFKDVELPSDVEKGMKTAYLDWIAKWNSMSGEEPVAIPALQQRITATPIGELTGGIEPYAQGEATADLNGDGKNETIRVVFREDQPQWEIKVGEITATNGYFSPEGAYLVDLDEGDNRLELAITDFGPSDDAQTELYALQNDELVHIGTVSGILFEADGKGRVSTYSRSNFGPMSTWFYQCEYQLDGEGKLVMMPTRWFASKLELTLKQDIPLYSGPDADTAGTVMKAGTAVVMDVSDISVRFHIVAADGTEGWLRFQDKDNLILPDGQVVGQTDALDGIISAD